MLRADLHPSQQALISDNWRYRSLLSGRRAGKTFGLCYDLLITGLETPEMRLLYGTLTRIQARNNIWDLLKRVNQRYSLGLEFHETNLEAYFPNGSQLWLRGLDSRAEVDRLRGPHFKKVWLDECASFPADILVYLIDEVLGPTLHDHFGQLGLAGTPGHVCAGPFFEATNAFQPNVRLWGTAKETFLWSFHKWCVLDNTRMPHIWDMMLAEKALKGWSDDSRKWRTESLGEWVPDSSLTVYNAFIEERDTWSPRGDDVMASLPEGHDWRYIIGVDVGFEDPFAVSALAYAPTCKTSYHCYTFKSPHLGVTEIAGAIKRCMRAMGGKPTAMVCDAGGFGKILMKTLNVDHGLYLQPANTRDKLDLIELLNDDYRTGRLKLLAGSPPVGEAKALTWVNEYKRDIVRSQVGSRSPDDHASDSILFAWAYAYHHSYRPVEDQPVKTQAELLEEREEQYIRSLSREEVNYNVDFEVSY